MTVLVGILCKDGVVIGADSAATLMAGQHRTIEQSVKKVEIVGEGRVIVAGTGSGGMGQRFTALVDQAWRDKVFIKPPIEVGKTLAAAGIKDFASTHAQAGQYGALVAFPCQKKPCLVEFGVTDFQPELKTHDFWYVSMGSGQMIADPFLGLIREAFWDDGVPSCKDATFVVTWILSQAIKLNTGGVNGPMQIAVMDSKSGDLTARMVDQTDLDGHEANVEGLIAHIRKYRDILRGIAVVQTPEVPKPEPMPKPEAANTSFAREKSGTATPAPSTSPKVIGEM